MTLVASAGLRQIRSNRNIYYRYAMDDFVNRWQSHPGFERMIRMSIRSFYKLVEYLDDGLAYETNNDNNRGLPIPHVYCVFMTLAYLAGTGTVHMTVMLGISKSSFYNCMIRTLLAIIKCPELELKFPTSVPECIRLARGFEMKSENGIISNCVGAVDGYLLAIKAPSKHDSGGNVRSYFSGHYKRYGLNVQAVCDCNCIIQYLAICAPGSANDRVAIKTTFDGTSLYDLIEALPPNYVIIADAAYEPTEHCVPVFYGNQRHNPANDNFNYYLSQVRTIIERTFGILQARFGILQKPMACSLKTVSLIVMAIARIHNFVLREKGYGIVENNPDQEMFAGLDEIDIPVQINPNDDQEENNPLYPAQCQSRIRDAMVLLVQQAGMERPPPPGNEGNNNNNDNE